jgi:adenylate cyclase
MSALWLALAGCALLAVLLWRARAEAARLRGRLEHASGELERLQLSFSRFAPDALVERILASGLPSRGERKEVTVLFADLVGYTPLAERTEPTQLVLILNGCFERMSRAIREQRGHVSAFIGDAILADWGMLEPDPWQADDALHAALAMRAELAAYNRELAARGLAPLGMGIALHRGSGIAALVGSRDRQQFTLVGRTINVAARVQALTREHDADILLTEDVKSALDTRFRLRELSPATLKGIAGPVRIWAAEGFDGGDASA